ncbi:hypothetical protein [Fibrella aquatilis]|uniref:DUF3471 domain-containing protein n=1 Tax=Fibrella aquatilis TaxID=2817059 RepID=A0A939G800_9BACT|nr:hypothetical protein [Fibrella aquatilis]MBO0931458.1 hypothetical protein [Fibrella aquatilis]
MYMMQKLVALGLVGAIMLGCSGQQVSESTSTTTDASTTAEASKPAEATAAQNAAKAPDPALDKYAGKYKMSAPTPGFDYVTISQVNGVLVAKTSANESFELFRMKDDLFDVPNAAGKAKFITNANKAIGAVVVTLEGKDFRGEKE